MHCNDKYFLNLCLCQCQCQRHHQCLFCFFFEFVRGENVIYSMAETKCFQIPNDLKRLLKFFSTATNIFIQTWVDWSDYCADPNVRVLVMGALVVGRRKAAINKMWRRRGSFCRRGEKALRDTSFSFRPEIKMAKYRWQCETMWFLTMSTKRDFDEKVSHRLVMFKKALLWKEQQLERWAPSTLTRWVGQSVTAYSDQIILVNREFHYCCLKLRLHARWNFTWGRWRMESRILASWDP